MNPEKNLATYVSANGRFNKDWVLIQIGRKNVFCFLPNSQIIFNSCFFEFPFLCFNADFRAVPIFGSTKSYSTGTASFSGKFLTHDALTYHVTSLLLSQRFLSRDRVFRTFTYFCSCRYSIIGSTSPRMTMI